MWSILGRYDKTTQNIREMLVEDQELLVPLHVRRKNYDPESYLTLPFDLIPFYGTHQASRHIFHAKLYAMRNGEIQRCVQR